MGARLAGQIGYPLLGVAVILAAWTAFCVLRGIPTVVLPTPDKVFNAFIARFDLLVSEGWVTLKETLYGFILALVVGIPMAVAIANSRALNLMFYPLLIGLQSVPKVALAPILLVWLGTGIESKLAIVWLVAFFPIIVDTVAGLRSTPRELLELAHSLRATPTADFPQSSVSGRAAIRLYRRQGRDHACGDWRRDRRIRRFKRGLGIPASQRHLAARCAARLRRPVRALLPWDVCLSSGRTGRAARRALVATRSAEALSDGKGKAHRQDRKPQKDRSQTQSVTKAASLADQAFEDIKEKILKLYFLPGQYLNEGALCALLKVGRTPVHQALQRLQHEGLVEIMPRKGVIVQPGSIPEILKILDSRATIEADLARNAATHASAKDAESLEGAGARRASAMARSRNSKASSTADRAFHRKFAELACEPGVERFRAHACTSARSATGICTCGRPSTARRRSGTHRDRRCHRQRRRRSCGESRARSHRKPAQPPDARAGSHARPRADAANDMTRKREDRNMSANTAYSGIPKLRSRHAEPRRSAAAEPKTCPGAKNR